MNATLFETAKKLPLAERVELAEALWENIEAEGYELDLTWLKDESLEDSDELPEPKDLAAEAVTELETVVDDLREIVELMEKEEGVEISDLLEQYHRSAVSRGLRPGSIASAEKELRRVARETGARRLADLTPATLQTWMQGCHLKPVTLRSLLRNAAGVFSQLSLQSMGLTEVQNPFAKLVRPKVDREAFLKPSCGQDLGVQAALFQRLRAGVDPHNAIVFMCVALQ